MLGEIRDLETASTAVQAALTGHPRASTLHTNDAPGLVTRLEHRVGAVPVGVGGRFCAKRLVRAPLPALQGQRVKPGGACRVPRCRAWTPDGVFVAKGCDKCRNTGYPGVSASTNC